MKLDINHHRARITAALKSADDTIGEKAATYLDVASGALNRIEELEKLLIKERAERILEGAPFCLPASTDDDVLGEEEECEHEGNCNLIQCPNKNWFISVAEYQLREEDHL